jgi:hypothetical protein
MVHYLLIYLFIISILRAFLLNTGDQTQDLVYARQVLFH